MAAPPASAIPGRCPSRSPRRSTRAISSVAAVLSGNRNFEGRIHPQVRANYLASPPLVVAYALAGSMNVDLTTRPARRGQRRQAGLSQATSGRRNQEIADTVRKRGDARRCSAAATATSSRARRSGSKVKRADGMTFEWDPGSTYLAQAALFRQHAEGAGRRSATSPARASWRSSATASPPTTSRPPARSRRTARPASICSSIRCGRPISIPTARGAAITR